MGSYRTPIGARGFQIDAFGLVWEMTEQTGWLPLTGTSAFVRANPLQRAAAQHEAPHSHQ